MTPKPTDDSMARGASSVLEALVASSTGALTMDRQGRLLWCNDAARSLLGLGDAAVDRGSLPALQDLWTLFPAAVREPRAPGAVDPWAGDMQRRNADGLLRTLRVEAVIRRDEHGLVDEATVLLRDLSETVRLHDELLYQASHDALTGLPNRAHLRRVSAEAVEHLRNRGGALALLFIDLDHVKEVNDMAGHEVGDQVIVHAGRRLTAALRPDDLVARLGGDEFVVLCDDMIDARAALEVAERIRSTVSERVDIAGHSIALAASIGVAVLTADAARLDDRPAAELADTLLQQADSAMYRAKQRGRGRCELFDEELGRHLAQRRRRGAALGSAIAEGCLTTAWLPVVDLVRNTTTGWWAEARWTLADGAVLGHREITDLAPGAGIEQALGLWLFQQATTAPATSGHLRVMVPCTAAQLGDPRTVESARGVAARLREQGMGLTVLIDESVLSSTDPDVDRSLRAFARFGVGLGITGLGGSSTPLRRLSELPVERLVMHHSLVADLGHSPAADVLTRSLVHLGHGLDAVVGAVVGTGDAASVARRTERLRALGCDEVISRPAAVATPQELTAN